MNKTETSNFIENFGLLQTEVHNLAKEKGWWDKPHKTQLECLMLIVSELSEAAEESRKDVPTEYNVNGKPEGLTIELADAVIRIMDFAESQNLDLASAIVNKHEYNKTRSYKHGKKI